MSPRFSILLVALIFASCSDLGTPPVAPDRPPESPEYPAWSPLVPGVVGVRFTDGTTIDDAERFVRHLGLTFKYPPGGIPLSAAISVPRGTEDEWITELRFYPIIESAHRIVVIVMPDSQ